MIVRVVKMTFVAEKLDDFLAVFAASKDKIRNFEGCQHLELLQDTKHKNILFTYSHWDSEAHLEEYRNSELFKTTWAKTKVLFAGKAEAWSLKAHH
jgi:quinol monooxygenase YgiN